MAGESDYCLEVLPRLNTVHFCFITNSKLTLTKDCDSILVRKPEGNGKSNNYHRKISLSVRPDFTTYSHVQLDSGVLSMKFNIVGTAASPPTPVDALRRCDTAAVGLSNLLCGFCASKVTKQEDM